jgi:methylthioribulose-1-phosphate dehydratase
MVGMGDFDAAAQQLCALARACAGRGSVPATSGNFSAVVSRQPLRLAITPSGADKGALVAGSILEIDDTGAVVRGEGRPSAEAAIHLAVVRSRDAGAVAHTHSVWAAVVSGRGDSVAIEGLEMLKALAGVTTHEHREVLPIVANTQDWAQGARAVSEALAREPAAHGLLIRGHGLYTWGRDTAEACRHVEALEYLLEVTGRLQWRS